MSIYRELNPEEEQDFRDWARENFKPGGEVNQAWHPVVRDECLKIELESKDFTK